MIAAALLLMLTSAGLPHVPAFGAQVTEGDPRNTAVMPEQRITLKFNHQVHLTQADLKCTSCHQDVEKSDKAKDYNIPPKSVCQDCHDNAEIGADWSADYKAKVNAVAIPPANLKFPHAKHVGQEGVTCLTCHVGVDTVKVATRDNLPAMETCLGCHDGKKAPNRCTTCHLDGPGGTMRTAYAAGLLKPDDHGTLWLKQHELGAERDMGYCASCHQQQDCISCHDGSIPPNFHDNNYLVIHRQEAIQNNPPCASCHDLDKFCADCHFRAERRIGQPLLPSFEGTFHPPGWNDYPPSREQHHAFVAEKSIMACTGCHVDNDCTPCHSFQGGAETHPEGWRNSTTMRRLLARNKNTCKKCHDPSDPSDPISEVWP